MKKNVRLAKAASYAIFSLLVSQFAVPAVAQTLQLVTDNGNHTTKNVWVGMSAAAGVTENALNVGGKVKLLGTADAYTVGTDANQPTIYRSGVNTGTAYPFNNYDHLVLQAGIQNRDIILLTGSTPTPRLVVTGAGNVGIGTSGPVHKLDIANGSVNIGTGANIAYRAGSYVSIGNMSYTNTPYIAFNAFLTTSDIATSKNLVTPNYNAGSGLIIRGEGGGSGLHFLQKNYANGTAPYDVNSFTEVFTITSAGTVGVGVTSTGSHRFAVEGSIGARKVKVTQGTWADFVFHPDYHLPSLQQVEQYVKTNQHLPDIPSAAEVQKEGLDLGEMNKKLLQKVEELTLYLIDMEKKMQQMQAEIKNLKDNNANK